MTDKEHMIRAIRSVVADRLIMSARHERLGKELWNYHQNKTVDFVWSRHVHTLNNAISMLADSIEVLCAYDAEFDKPSKL